MENAATLGRRQERHAAKKRARNLESSLLCEELCEVADDMASEYSMVGDDEDALELEAQIQDFVEQDFTEAEDKGGSAIFKLSRLCTIESDGKPHKQTVGSVQLTPTFSYVASPAVNFSECTSSSRVFMIFI